MMLFEHRIAGLCRQIELARMTEVEGESMHLEMMKEDLEEAERMMEEAARKREAAMATKRDAAKKRGIKGEGKDKAVKMSDEEKMKRKMEKYAEWKKRHEAQQCDKNAEEVKDPYASFQQMWNEIYGKKYGGFKDNTKIPCMRFTYNPPARDATTCETLQVFSVKVAEISGGLQWPLDVYGMVALRDSLDHNRNIIFKCPRENCQTLTDQNQCLVLIGPLRAVDLCDTVVFEVLLYVRGTTRSDDKELSILATSFWKGSCPSASRFITQSYTSRRSTLEFRLGHIVYSVEATISVRVISRSWPDGFHGRFVALTDSINEEILLLDSGDKEVPLTGDDINLSRHVVSVEINGNLRVGFSASDGNVTLSDEVEFKPMEKSTSSKTLGNDPFCQLEVTVAWSLFSFLS